MNSIQKQKALLIGLGIILVIVSILLASFGAFLTVKGAVDLSGVSGIVKLVFGILMILAFFPALFGGIRFIWVGCSLIATMGSIKQGNIAKEGGTVNMKKCDKCGTELKDGQTECPECGKKFEEQAKNE